MIKVYVSSVIEAPADAVWLLKSRSTAHTRSMGASMTADRVTRIMGSGQRRNMVFNASKAVWKTPWPIC